MSKVIRPTWNTLLARDYICITLILKDTSMTIYIIKYVSIYLFCFVFLQYDCLNAPLNVENDPFAWWTDRHDNTHIYWTGDGQDVYKGCQCGLKVRKNTMWGYLEFFFRKTKLYFHFHWVHSTNFSSQQRTVRPFTYLINDIIGDCITYLH